MGKHEKVDQKAGKGHKGIWILTVLVLIALLVLTTCILMKEKGSTMAGPSGNVIQGARPGLSQEEKEALIREQQDKSMFTLSFDSAGTVNSDGQSASLYVANLACNRLHCHFELVVGDEVLYTSPDMAPDTYMVEMKLARALSPGTYKVVIRHYLSDENGATGGVVDGEANLVVQ